jgi:hypothetical protein
LEKQKYEHDVELMRRQIEEVEGFLKNKIYILTNKEKAITYTYINI